MRAVAAPVPADDHLQNRGPPPERLMREPPNHRVTQHTSLAAATAPVIRFHHPAGQHRPSGFESLANHFKAELIDTAERGQVRTSEGSVAHVEVFQTG